MFSASEVFDIAIQLEENGERFYRKAVLQVRDEDLRELLIWLAEQEMHHRESFVKMKSDVKRALEDRWAEEASGAILQSAMGEHGFSLDEVSFSSIPDVTALLKVAIGFENDGIVFYELIRSFVDDAATLIQLDRIIQEERAHVRLFEERLKSMETCVAN
ncbi:MAG: ferritin family protein [Syntrophobacteraceae bacterium]|nr:ferritin family protein [Syntrophobacteraceae bacterium]